VAFKLIIFFTINRHVRFCILTFRKDNTTVGMRFVLSYENTNSELPNKTSHQEEGYTSCMFTFFLSRHGKGIVLYLQT
jgi:hypothetical protein